MSQKKRLILMRHGQAESASFSDKDRKLTDQGCADTIAIAKEWWGLGWHPQSVLVSSATRTQMTWRQVQQGTGIELAPNICDSLYLSGYDKLMFELSGLAPGVETILVIGHNPGLSDIAGQLSGQPVGLSPGQAALLSLTHTDWVEAYTSLGTWHLEKIVTV